MDILERNYKFYFNIYEPCSPSETSAAMFVCTQTFCGIRKRFTNGTVHFFSVFCRCGMSSTICRKIITKNSIQMVSALDFEIFFNLINYHSCHILELHTCTLYSWKNGIGHSTSFSLHGAGMYWLRSDGSLANLFLKLFLE